MSITAKELAKLMGLSEAAISMALNNKPGVSTKTRKKVLQKATELGYDFSRLNNAAVEAPQIQGTINFVVYRKSGAVVPFQGAVSGGSMDIPFFSQLSEGIDTGCKQHHFYLNISYVYEDDDLDELISVWKSAGVKGLIVLGTEMGDSDIKPFLKCEIPIVLLDNYFDNRSINCIMINNVQGAYIATQYLIRKKQSQPGYLHSSYSITGFEERGDGFYKALRKNGISTSQAIVHRLTPSLEGAYSDMKELLQHGERTARCYFADNDQIAAGAMKALQEAGYQIPQDISIIGFDDMPLCNFVSPPLSTIHVPKEYMGELAVNRLVEIMNHPNSAPVKIEVSTELRKRKSC